MKRITDPAESPVSLGDMKAYLRVDGDDENTLIESLIDAAVEYAEEFTRRAFITQTWEITLQEFPAVSFIRLPKPPLQTVTVFQYTNANGVTEDFEEYLVSVHNNLVMLTYGDTWPSVTLNTPDPIVLQYECGYGDDPGDVPEPLRTAIKAIVANWYENREPVVVGTIAAKIPLTVEAILAAYRVVEFS